MLAASKEVTPHISRLTAKARAAGIHLILATQRPDAKIITGTIKANIPGRVAFKTSTSIDSRTILDDTGAENLIGKGDMLFKTKEGLLIRAQGAWISDPEIERIVTFIEEHSNTQFDEKFATKLGRVKEAGIEDPFASNEDDPDNQEPKESAAAPQVSSGSDDLFVKALEVIVNTKRASVSHFQRRLGIGYNNAARLCDRLEDAGVIGPQASGAGPRSILMTPEQIAELMGSSAAAAPAAEPAPAAPAVGAANAAGDGFYITQDDLFAE
jgi:S-DNA-T family DNA segregation ATPase FtsK/SpoIIIE